MRIAAVGSRSLKIEDLQKYLPKGSIEFVSGGAKGADACAREYADANGLRITEFLPEYEKYGRLAPLLRNRQIVEYADRVIVFWDGESRGTKYVIALCKTMGKAAEVYTAGE